MGTVFIVVLFAKVGSAQEDDPGLSRMEDRLEHLVLRDEGGRVVLVPGFLMAPSYILRINRADDDKYEGSGVVLLEAEAGFSARFVDMVKIALVVELLGGGTTLKDAYLELDPWASRAAFRFGLFKIPFSRQYDVSASRRQLVLGATSRRLAASRRSFGAQFSSQAKGLVKTQLAVMSREGDEFGFKVDRGVVASGRFWFDLLGEGAGSGETDLVGTAGPGMSAGLAVLFERAADEIYWHGQEMGEFYDENRFVLGPQLALKHGWFSVQMEFFYRRTWVASGTPARISRGEPGVNGVGGYAQLGLFLGSRKLELVGRFDAHDEDLDVAGWYLAPTGGLTWYIWGRHLKVQTLYRVSLKADDPFIEGAPMHTPTTHTVVCSLVVGL